MNAKLNGGCQVPIACFAELNKAGANGGELKLPLPLIPIMERGIQGSYTGSPGDMKELMELVRSGKVDPIHKEQNHYQ